MKEFIKVVNLLIIGLAVAIFIYPMLHELGHSVFALCVGSEVSDVTLFPLPAVVCRMDTQKDIAVALVGFGGMLLPFIITLLPPPSRFVWWYMWFVTKGICVLSFGISIVSLVLFQIGNPVANEDITQVMGYAPQYVILYYVIILALLAVTCIQMMKSAPIRRCIHYFDAQ